MGIICHEGSSVEHWDSAPILSFYAFPLPFPLLPSLLGPRDWTIGPYIYFLFPPTIGLNEYGLNRELNPLVRDFLMDGCSVSSPLLGAVDVESNNNQPLSSKFTEDETRKFLCMENSPGGFLRLTKRWRSGTGDNKDFQKRHLFWHQASLGSILNSASCQLYDLGQEIT